jgi:hypothetical protein
MEGEPRVFSVDNELSQQDGQPLSLLNQRVQPVSHQDVRNYLRPRL